MHNNRRQTERKKHARNNNELPKRMQIHTLWKKKKQELKKKSRKHRRKRKRQNNAHNVPIEWAEHIERCRKKKQVKLNNMRWECNNNTKLAIFIFVAHSSLNICSQFHFGTHELFNAFNLCIAPNVMPNYRQRHWRRRTKCLVRNSDNVRPLE